MAKVILGMTTSLDGFIADQNGRAGRLYPDVKRPPLASSDFLPQDGNHVMSTSNSVVLVVIDMLVDFFERVPALANQRRALVTGINELTAFFRAAEYPVIWIRQEFKPDLSDAFLDMKRRGISITIEGAEGSKILPEIERRPIDFEIVKKRYSAFLHTSSKVVVIAGALLSFTACTSRTASMNKADLTDFATRYAAAWSSQDPVKFASFYAENGSLTVNDGAPSVGRAAITATARGYMTAFPDMVVKLDSLSKDTSHAIFHWTWTGTNTGPGGTGKPVHLSGYEQWTIGADGLIAESKGHFDEAEYQRQLK